MSTATTTTPATASRTAARIGWALTALLAIFLIFDGVTKLINVQQVRDATVDLGLREEMTPVIGVVLLVCVALYLVPRTAFLGAVLLTGYLGGAVLTNWRVDKPLFSTVLFAVYMGVAVWAALYLRDPRVRQVMPIVR
ncbi:MAG: DoxX family protein [Rhodococcus sp. (in: high G+C Gram-positive bacteria)]